MENSFDVISEKNFNCNNILLFHPDNVPIVFAKLPQELYNLLVDEVEKIKNNFDMFEKHNNSLAGHIKREYNLIHCKNILENFILNIISEYQKKCEIISKILTYDTELVLDSLWVNFQKKYEFNPPHNHTGIFSFVIWMKIPYDLKEEDLIFSEVNKQKYKTSRFCFSYTNIFGKISQVDIPVDKNYEGVLSIFPSELTHYVNPFYTSDDYRISISGNVYFDTKSK